MSKIIKGSKYVKSAEVKSPSILGTFEGECADANITNLNGLDITRPVWETVFSSEEYKKAIELGHLIGFLGHPEDPNCMDFEHACIVMKEGHIDDDGKVRGKFDLVDTPVGRIVKTFIDAGVKFGISVRGAGDIENNSVDPDTFVFRGFDLVSFPAYPDSIPEFIAASSDLDSQRKYKAISAAIKKNKDGLNTVESVDILQSHLAKQSDEYKMLENRKSEIEDCDDIDIRDQKIDGMTDLYLNECQNNKKLKDEIAECKKLLNESIKANATLQRKFNSMKRIVSSQSIKVKEVEENSDRQIAEVKASRSVDKRSIEELNRKLADKSSELERLRRVNLKYKQRIETSSNDIADKDSVISSLRADLDETVNQVKASEAKTSNLDAVNRRLKSKVSACEKLLAEYQDAYADIYANALGVHLDSLPVSASTSVSDIRNMISGSVSLKPSTQLTSEPTSEDLMSYGDDDSELITL